MYKTRKKNIGKANKKTTDKNFLPLCIKKKQAIFTQKRRERATQLFYQQHTHTKTTTTTRTRRATTLNNGIIK
jgi:hypothetical protein